MKLMKVMKMMEKTAHLHHLLTKNESALKGWTLEMGHNLTAHFGYVAETTTRAFLWLLLFFPSVAGSASDWKEEEIGKKMLVSSSFTSRIRAHPLKRKSWAYDAGGMLLLR